MSRAGEPSKDSPGLEVGRVSKAHGIAGELRIVPHWESSDALEQVQEIWLTREGKRTAYALERARAVPRAYLVKLRGVDDRQLLDMGLVRAADGSLWLAEDPSRPVVPDPLQRRAGALWRGVAGFWHRFVARPSKGENGRLRLSQREGR